MNKWILTLNEWTSEYLYNTVKFCSKDHPTLRPTWVLRLLVLVLNTFFSVNESH